MTGCGGSVGNRRCRYWMGKPRCQGISEVGLREREEDREEDREEGREEERKPEEGREYERGTRGTAWTGDAELHGFSRPTSRRSSPGATPGS